MAPNEILLKAIQEAKKPEDFQRALANYYKAADANTAECVSRTDAQLACREGCAFCCYLRVGVRAHEVFLIADFVRNHFSLSEQADLISRLRQHVARVSRMTEIEHQTTNVPCPLLDGVRCSVYSVRPFACRGYHSLNVSSCAYSFEHPQDTVERRPTDPRLEGSWQMMCGLAHGVYESEKYDGNAYELGAALLEALTNPATARRWRDGKKAFPAINADGDTTTVRTSEASLWPGR